MKEAVITSVSIVCGTFLIAFGLHVYTRPKKHDSIHVFTNCVATLMSESRQSGKVIEAREASELCEAVNRG